MPKTLIYTLPPNDTDRPPVAGAILASICSRLGHECQIIDLQVELYKFLDGLLLPRNMFDAAFYKQTDGFDQHQLETLQTFVSQETARHRAQQYDHVLISCFSYLAQSFVDILLPALRPQTSAKIVLGGAGVAFEPAQQGLYAHVQGLKQQGLIDEYIVGEAENTLPDYFAYGHGPGIGNADFKQVQDLDSQPWPDYSYYDFNDYNLRSLVIIGSRGCVRRCTFCNVARTSPRYYFRSGANIASEIIKHYETHGVTDFYFADSLVNGSYKAFNDMCEHLAAYPDSHRFSWSGQYIIRPRTSTPDNHFDLLSASGCKTLFVGIESGSDRVRFEIGKKFTNDDIEFYLENFAQHDIGVLFLMITGFVGETEADHAETLSMFPRWQRYVATGTIQGLETLNVLTILAGTELENQARQHQFQFLANHRGEIMRQMWLDPRDPGLDFPKRVARHIEMLEHAMRYHWPLWNGKMSVDMYHQALLEFRNMPKKRYIPLMVAVQ